MAVIFTVSRVKGLQDWQDVGVITPEGYVSSFSIMHENIPIFMSTYYYKNPNKVLKAFEGLEKDLIEDKFRKIESDLSTETTTGNEVLEFYAMSKNNLVIHAELVKSGEKYAIIMFRSYLTELENMEKILGIKLKQ